MRVRGPAASTLQKPDKPGAGLQRMMETRGVGGWGGVVRGRGWGGVVGNVSLGLRGWTNAWILAF